MSPAEAGIKSRYQGQARIDKVVVQLQVRSKKGTPLRSILSTALLLIAFGANAEDYAAWRGVNRDGSWTKAAESAVAATLLSSAVPRDIERFCPNYEASSPEDRKRFWVGLLSAIARPESNFKPETTYLEPSITDSSGKNVTSRGLLQISLESSRGYRCGIENADELHDPGTNLRCGAKIMDHWIRKDSVIAAEEKPAVGGARYWSVLRAWRKHLPEIGGFTKSLAVCKRKS